MLMYQHLFICGVGDRNGTIGGAVDRRLNSTLYCCLESLWDAPHLMVIERYI